MDGTLIEGNAIQTLERVTLEQCHNACITFSTCMHFSYITFGKHCSLFSTTDIHNFYDKLPLEFATTGRCEQRNPSSSPSISPTPSPTTAMPSEIPSNVPSSLPTTDFPTISPASVPTIAPSSNPSFSQPSLIPSTNDPTVYPTINCREHDGNQTKCMEMGCLYFGDMGDDFICAHGCKNSTSLSGKALGRITYHDNVEECEQRCLLGIEEGCIALNFDLVDKSCALLKTYDEQNIWKENMIAKICVETSDPTKYPSMMPSRIPSVRPTYSPTLPPSDASISSPPTCQPITSEPTNMPTTSHPTSSPTSEPTTTPTCEPTSAPTPMPTDAPSAIPTPEPTAMANTFVVIMKNCNETAVQEIRTEFEGYNPQEMTDGSIMLNRYHVWKGIDLTATWIETFLSKRSCEIDKEKLITVGTCQDETPEFWGSCKNADCNLVEAKESCCMCENEYGGHGGSIQILDVKEIPKMKKRTVNIDAVTDIDLSMTGHSHWSLLFWIEGYQLNFNVFILCNADNICLKLAGHDHGFRFELHTKSRRFLQIVDRNDERSLNITKSDVLTRHEISKHIAIVINGSKVEAYVDSLHHQHTLIDPNFRFFAGYNATLQFGTDKSDMDVSKIVIGDMKYFKTVVREGIIRKHKTKTENDWVREAPLNDECESFKDCAANSFRGSLSWFWVLLGISFAVLFIHLSTIDKLFKKRVRKLPCFLYLGQVFNSVSSLMFLWLTWRSKKWFFWAASSIMISNMIFTLFLLHYVFLKKKYWGWWWIFWVFISGGDIERCIGLFQSGIVPIWQMFTDMSDNMMWKVPFCKEKRWTINVKYMYIYFLAFDLLMILCQIGWAKSTGSYATNFLISIFFSLLGLLVKLIRKGWKALKYYKGKYNFEDFYVYPWIIQVKRSNTKEETQWTEKQALSPDLWLLASKLEEYLNDKTNGTIVEVQISQRKYHNIFRVWGGADSHLSSIEEFLNLDEHAHKDYLALHFLNHPHYQQFNFLEDTDIDDFKFIVFHGKSTDINKLPDAEFSDTNTPMSQIKHIDRIPQQVYIKANEKSESLTPRKTCDGKSYRELVKMTKRTPEISIGCIERDVEDNNVKRKPEKKSNQSYMDETPAVDDDQNVESFILTTPSVVRAPAVVPVAASPKSSVDSSVSVVSESSDNGSAGGVELPQSGSCVDLRTPTSF